MTAGGKRGDGSPIMARHWLDELATPTMAALPPDWRELRQPTAGLGWWLNRNGAWPAAPPDTMVAAGSGHQLLLAIPSIGLTTVRLGDKMGADGFGGDYWQAFEAELLNPLLELLRTEHLAAELEPPPPAG